MEHGAGGVVREDRARTLSADVLDHLLVQVLDALLQRLEEGLLGLLLLDPLAVLDLLARLVYVCGFVKWFISLKRAIGRLR